jgi:hypothetical protein
MGGISGLCVLLELCLSPRSDGVRENIHLLAGVIPENYTPDFVTLNEHAVWL